MADKKPDARPDLDLFGAPVDQIRDRWGRRSFAKSEANQRLVATLKAAGWSQMRIARYLDCDEKTLRKHFSRELSAGADLVEGQALEVLIGQMRQGKLSAVKRTLDLVEANRAKLPETPRPEAPAEDKPERLGKKELLDRAARQPGSGWGGLVN